MSEEKKHRIYTAADIEKYHKGLLSPKQMHELEKAALDDPFLADALEGYGTASVNISTDIAELEKKLEKSISKPKVINMTLSRDSLKWWKVAAAVVIIGSIGYFTFGLLTGKKTKSVAALDKKKNQQASKAVSDSGKFIKPETTHVTGTSKQEETIATATSITKSSATSLSKNDKSNGPVASEANSIAKDALNLKGENSDSISDKKNLSNEKDDNVNVLAQAKQPVPNSDKQLNRSAAFEKQAMQRDSLQMNYFRGHVTDVNNNPLPFANITNTRDNVGTYADAQGNFTLISPDSVLDVQIRSMGFENNLTRLKNNVTSNEVILQDDKAVPDKIISYQKPNISRPLNGSMKLEEPEPADGWANYDTYLANNINVSDALKMNQKRGLVELSFEVNQNGDPINIRVEKSLCQKCDEEAVRLIRQGPKWKKKIKKAKRVTVAIPFETNQ